MKSVIDHIRRGGVIAYPTETLWGLGADITNSQAVDRIFQIKERELSKAVSLLVRDVFQAKEIAQVSPEVEELLFLFWPGPITFVLPAQESLLAKLRPQGTVGLRCSSDPELRQLMTELDHPIITTSANKSGEPPAHSAQDLAWLSKDVKIWREDVVLPESKGSTVVGIDKKQFQIFRAGDFAVEKIKSVMLQHGFSAKDEI